jgi:ribonuclease E
MSQFGIIEMTRQRMRPSLKRSVYFDCPHCKGAGLVKTPESMSLDVMRRLRIAINDLKVQRVELAVCPDVAFYLQNKKRQPLGELERQYDKRILIRADAQLGLDEMKIDLYDSRDGLVFLESLGMVPQPPHTTQLGTKPQQFPQRGRGREDRGRGGRRPESQRSQPSTRNRDEEPSDDRFERVEAQYDEEEGEEGSQQSAPQETRLRQDDSRGRQNGGRQRQSVHRQPPRSRDQEEDIETPALETEAGSEASDPTEAVAGHGQNAQEEEGGPRRRRRRRGRRGRGRNRQQALEGQPQGASNGNPADRPENGELEREEAIADEAIESHDSEEISSEDIDARSYDSDRSPESEVADRGETAEIEPEKHPAKKASDANEEESAEPAESKPRRRRRGGRGRGRGKKVIAKSEGEEATQESAAAKAEPTPEHTVIRTGSTDRHLIEDEPAFSPPVRRPRSIRDLDSIPDDFD